MNKKIISCLIMGFILCSSLNAQTTQEGNKGLLLRQYIRFPLPAFAYKCSRQTTKNNRQTLQLLKKRLQTFFTKRKDTLYVNGYSGNVKMTLATSVQLSTVVST